MNEKKSSQVDLNSITEQKKGVAYATLCYFLWGLLPVYWKTLSGIDPLLILFYRIVATALFALVLGWIIGRKQIFDPVFFKRPIIFTFVISGLLISCNWGIYIWAVNHDQIIQASLGYYINPLITSLFGMIFFHEKPNIKKTIALLLSAAGVAYMVIGFGRFPIVAISLPLLFASYGAIKKKLQFHSIYSLFYETVYLTPIALVLILYYEKSGKGAFTTASVNQLLMLGMVGLVTAVPLLLFAVGANRLKYTTMGMIQYFSPTISLLLGIFIYHEPFSSTSLVTFVLIWAGIILYTLDGWKQMKQLELQKVAEAIEREEEGISV